MDNIVWITGGSSGIGKEITKKFIKNDFNVAVTSRNLDKKYFDYDEQKLKNLQLHSCDISDNQAVLKTYKNISQTGFVDCLINNAGITSFTLAKDDSVDMIKKIIDVNLLGAIYTIKSVLPAMIENKKGTIINILSVAAEKIFSKSSAYAASKAGLLAYTNVIREELREFNIKVINILPGATATPIWPSNALEKFSFRMMNPEDLAEFVFNAAVNSKNIIAEEITLRPIQGDL
jgi:short-subunit dehydrogenase